MTMAEQSTFIKLDRNILRWRWFQNGKVLHVFLFLLLNANVEDHEFENEIIHRGEVVTSLANIEKSTGLTTSQIRNIISTLKRTGEITSRFTNRYRVITIVNYDKYQDNRQSKRQANEQSTDSQATSKQQQYKNIKNDKNERIYNGGRKAPPVFPSGESPTGEPERGTNEFRAKSHLLLKEDEGTVDDIPYQYRKMFDNFQDYWRYRNQ